MCRFEACICMLNPMHTKNPNFDYTFCPISNGHNPLNINPNHAKFMFKLKPMISNFQLNNSHSNILCGSKVVVIIVRNCHFSTSFSRSDLSTFELWLFSNLCELFNYLWLMYGAGDQRLLTGTKWDIYIVTTKNLVQNMSSMCCSAI